MFRSRTIILAACAAIGALAISACGSTPSTGKPAAFSTAVPSSKITLNMADYEQATIQQVLGQLQGQFTQKYGNVSFSNAGSITDVGAYATKEKLAMAGPSGPDIIQVGQDQALMGPLVKANLLMNLNQYAQTYGWADKFGPGLLDELTMQTDGKQLGAGNLYGVSLGGNLVGVYYNKAKLSALGFSAPPQTLAEFEQMLAAAKAAGQVPLEAGTLDKWPAAHYLDAMLAVYCPPGDIRNWIYGNSGTTIDSDCAKAAVAKLADWTKNGYISKNANGTAYADAMNAFAKGTGIFNLTGSWEQAQFDQQAPGQIGFFLLPPVNAGDKPAAVGALTPPYAISAKSKNPAAAAAFLDSLLTPQATDKLAAVGVLPVLKGYQLQATAGSALADVYASWQQVLNSDGLSLYTDWSSPAMLDVIESTVQLVFAGTSTNPDDVLGPMQKEWGTFH
jgi:raffinose/stachyose/melibiose transport system substrate-binding protein